MEEKMKKMLFLMLFLIILGAANVNSQVRIGGNGVPNGAAVLDLNVDDNTNSGTKGLALPRVSLTDINTALAGSPTVNGMMVYNTNASVGAGIYYWDSNKWIKVSDGTFVEGDGVVGNEIADVVPGGGLKRYGNGTNSDAYKVGLDTALVRPYGSLVWSETNSAWVPSRGQVVTYLGEVGLAIHGDWFPMTVMMWDVVMPTGTRFIISTAPPTCWRASTTKIACVNATSDTIDVGDEIWVTFLGW